MFIEGLLYGALRAISGIGRTVQDEQSKRDSTYVNNKGQTVCYGRTGQQYVNGEKTYRWSETDKNGYSHDLTIGVNSGKVYNDSYDLKVARWNKEAEEAKKRSQKFGFLSYKRFNPRFHSYVTVEIQTGKIITCLFKNSYNKECRKFYLKDETIQKYGKLAYRSTAPNDYGVVISEEEYRLLESGTSNYYYTEIPDEKVYKELIREPEEINKIKTIETWFSYLGERKIQEMLEDYFKSRYSEKEYRKVLNDRKKKLYEMEAKNKIM